MDADWNIKINTITVLTIIITYNYNNQTCICFYYENISFIIIYASRLIYMLYVVEMINL